ncbi:MAG: hypothetical protein Q7T03_08735 [Deltaproteobacteria bacterium]|nr:hypothetical protein [Deltaproteobacteria bacterium]
MKEREILEMNIKIKNFLPVFLLFVTSCGSTSVSPSSNEKIQGPAPAVAAQSLNPKIENYMTFDLLGGVFRKPETSNTGAMLFDFTELESNSVSAGKTSINLSPNEKMAATQESSFVVDSSYTFIGKAGYGRLVISLSGSGKDVSSVRHYAPLKLRFLFYKYAFDNRCVGEIYLHGEIQCDVEGDYNLSTQNFIGKAHCFNGPQTKPGKILYITRDHNYEIELDGGLTINGNPLLYRSYSYEGDIIIDGMKKQIEELIQDGDTCS